MIYRAIEAANARRVALVGIAKHAGKTTAMNRLIEEAAAGGKRLGLVSIGVDGERNDAIMGVPKPEVHVPVGALVASAGDVLTAGSAGLTIVERTGITSTLGDVYLAEVTQPGTVLLAGIRYAAQVADVLERMERRGAELCLVDGAFDRMMAACPKVTDGVVLATGAVVANSVEEVAQKTALFLQRFALPLADEQAGRLLDLAEETGGLVVGVEEEQGIWRGIPLEQRSSFTANPIVDPNWPGGHVARGLAVTGAVTDRLLGMLEGVPSGFTLVIPDATHFFASPAVWRKFLRRRHQVVVRRQVRVFGLTVNPHSVAGFDLPRERLLQAVQDVAGDLLVRDVLRPES